MKYNNVSFLVQLIGNTQESCSICRDLVLIMGRIKMSDVYKQLKWVALSTFKTIPFSSI